MARHPIQCLSPGFESPYKMTDRSVKGQKIRGMLNSTEDSQTG